jgi:signal recognition particle subunit SRP54
VGKQIKDLDIDDNAFKGIEAIISSMTPKERQNPDIINQSRKLRIAKGSGTKLEDVNRLLKQFDQTRKVMRMMTGVGSSKMAQMAAAMKMRGGMPKF